ncbi:MAG: hypothetical protein WC548_03715 [Candidatus Pacearchaeota archaeon]
MILVGISGLSQSGKTTFANSLEEVLGNVVSIDGDKYQPGREVGMPIYKEAIEAARQGRLDPNFHHQVWNYQAMKEQIFDPIAQFNQSPDYRITLQLRNVMNVATKRSDSMHDETVEVNKDQTLIMPFMYQGHLGEQFDYRIRLLITPQTSVDRKIARDLAKGVQRDPKTTMEMVQLVEFPAMQHEEEEFPLRNVIKLDTNDFTNIKFL